ncbi:putative F-box/kelch-repeat protein [Raphanus sativus]|nr:putative F-box/kelch-repeat protein [Raphanus sativus]
MYIGYDTRNGKWLQVHGLDEVYTKLAKNHRTIQLVNHGGKLVIIWHQWDKYHSDHKGIWCAVISLEERLTPLGNMLWGKVERCNAVLDLVHKSYTLSSCISVLV